MYQILLLDGTNQATKRIKLLSSLQHYTITHATNIQEALRQSRKKVHLLLCHYRCVHDTDYVVIDLLRQRFLGTSLVIYAAEDNTRVAVACLKRGADDYLLQSLTDQDFMTNIRQIETVNRELDNDLKGIIQDLQTRLSRMERYLHKIVDNAELHQLPPQVTQLLQLDPIQKTLQINEHVLPLTDTEFDILYCLVEAGEQVCSYEYIRYQIHGVYSSRKSARKSLSAHMSNLRKKLDDVGCDDVIINRWGEGFIFNINYATSLSKAEQT